MHIVLMDDHMDDTDESKFAWAGSWGGCGGAGSAGGVGGGGGGGGMALGAGGDEFELEREIGPTEILYMSLSNGYSS